MLVVPLRQTAPSLYFRLLIASLFFTLATAAFAEPPLNPNPDQTPGELCSKDDDDFMGYYYGEKLPKCRRNVSSAEKAAIFDAYAIPKSSRRDYTIDHFIPLSIGGNNDVENLWPEHYKIKETRQNLELGVFMQVRDGDMTQQEAIEIIRSEKMRDDIDPNW